MFKYDISGLKNIFCRCLMFLITGNQGKTSKIREFFKGSSSSRAKRGEM